MGNNVIVIHSVGCHHNGIADDGEQLAKLFVDHLRAAGHSIISARHDAGGSIDLLNPQGALRTLEQPDEHARRAYERYLKVTDGLNYEGKPCPKWEDLTDKVKTAWRAAVDPTQPRLVR